MQPPDTVQYRDLKQKLGAPDIDRGFQMQTKNKQDLQAFSNGTKSPHPKWLNV